MFADRFNVGPIERMQQPMTVTESERLMLSVYRTLSAADRVTINRIIAGLSSSTQTGADKRV